jgi:hypothetical protein
MPISEKELIRRVTAASMPEIPIPGEERLDDNVDDISKTIQAIASQLRTLATKPPVARVRFGFALAQNLVRTFKQDMVKNPAAQNMGDRGIRELRRILTEIA